MHCGEEKWIGGILLPTTGKIIGIPYAAETVLEIDPATHSTSTFGIVSSSVKRKWLGGVLGRNGLIYAIPYDADVVLEINPYTKALMLFGRVGGDPCKWYGGVLGPNDKIYAIPYSSPYVLEIDTERRIARPFAMTFPHWGKWSGGVLAPNGKIYGMPALAKSVLEIDIESESTSFYGMLPGGDSLQDKWSGGVLAPNGRIYGVPWRSSKVLEFDPATKALSLLGSELGSSNFSWGGAAVAKSGKIIALPYNGAGILEIGESVCTQAIKGGVAGAQPAAVNRMLPPLELPAALSAPGPKTPLPSAAAALLPSATPSSTATLNLLLSDVPPPAGQAGGVAQANALYRGPTETRTFVLALLGCPDENKASEDYCFHLGHRTWHSAMVTIMKADSTLAEIRGQAEQSRLSHVPTNFCFLYNGHSLDPNVETTITAGTVAVATSSADTREPQSIILIDNVHCNINKFSIASSAASAIGWTPGNGPTGSFVLGWVGVIALSVYLVARCLTKPDPRHHGYYSAVALEAQEATSLIDDGKPHDRNDHGKPQDDSVPCLNQVARLRPLFHKTMNRAQNVAYTFRASPHRQAHTPMVGDPAI